MRPIVWNIATLLLIWVHVTAGNEDSTKSVDSRSYYCDCEPPPGCIGAVYFATNNELENWVVVNCIQPNGTLLFNNTISTRGNGSSKFEQYNLVNYVITGDNFLFVGNSGSDSVSMFSIDPYSPEKLTFVTSVPSQGNFPASLAYSSVLEVLCVLNAGENNSVACFKVTTTGLTLLPNTVKSVGKSQPNPPQLDNSVSHITFTQNAKQLVVSLRGTEVGTFNFSTISTFSDPGSIVVFTFLNESTALGDPVVNPVLHFYPIELTLIPPTIKNGNNNQQNMLYSTGFNCGSGLQLFAVSPNGTIDTSPYVHIPRNRFAGWSKFSPQTGLLYTTDAFNKQLTETRIEFLNNGRLSGTVLNHFSLDFSLDEFLFARINSGEFLYSMISARGGADPIIQVIAISNNPANVTLIQNFAPDRDVIIAQTGQGLQVFSQGIAAFIAQPRSGSDGGYHTPCEYCGHDHYPPSKKDFGLLNLNVDIGLLKL